MIYRNCNITPEYIGYSWAHPEYDGPADNGEISCSGHGQNVFECKNQIDNMYADTADQEQVKFSLWEGTRQ